MYTRLINIWEKLRTSFWLVPAAIVLAALAAFLILLEFDRDYESSAFLFFDFLEPLSPSGARIILSTIAGSMITVAGTVFSITIVTLTLASNQFGPRLLRNFMQSTINQVVLGSFIATFVYCLCVLGSIEPAGRESFVPGLSANFAIVLAIFNVAILIYFIHHVAISIQVETVIKIVNQDLIKSIHEFFPEKGGKEKDGAIAKLDENPNQHIVHAKSYGYLQAINSQALEAIADECNFTLTLEQKPGVFITKGLPLVCISHNHPLSEENEAEISSAFLLGSQRTSEQDVEYSIHQLVEIAVRALSPGVNDPFTAIACIDYLESMICQIMERNFPASCAADSTGRVLVKYKIVTFSGIVKSAFDQIRQHGSENAAVLLRLLNAIRTCYSMCENDNQKKVLLRHAEMIYRAGMNNLPEDNDKKEIEEIYEYLISKRIDSD